MPLPFFTTTKDIESMEDAAYEGLRHRILEFLAEGDMSAYDLAAEIGTGATNFQNWINGKVIGYTMSLRSLYKLHLLGVTSPLLEYHYQVGPLDLPERPGNANYPEVRVTSLGAAGAMVTIDTENDLGDPVRVTMTSSTIKVLKEALGA